MLLRFLATALLVAIACSAEARTIHSERSLYRNILVTEDAGLRCMTFRRQRGGHRQTCVKLDDEKDLVFPYARMMIGALYLAPQPNRVLIIGLGGGTLPMTVRGLLPDAQIDVVEIDPAVVRVARAYFPFRPDAKMAVFEEDGRVFIKKQLKAGTKYDLIMLDAFEDDYIPEHLLTKEFLIETRTLLAPRGVVAANTFSSSKLYPHESTTYAAVFGAFYNLKLANRVIWAQEGGIGSADELRKNAAPLEEKFKAHGITTDWLMTLLSEKPDWNPDARILTDQYSPSNILNAR